MRLLKEADVLLALGTRLNRFGTVPQYDIEYFPKSAKLIQNSINPLEIGAMFPISAGLLGDCRAVTEQLLAATEGKTPKADVKARRARTAQEKEQWAKELEDMSRNDQSPMTPRRALWEIAKATPENAAIVCDVGSISGTAGAYFGFDQHRRWFGHGSLGGIGVGYATALGVKLGRPDLPVLTLGGETPSRTMSRTGAHRQEYSGAYFADAEVGKRKRIGACWDVVERAEAAAA